MRKIGIKQFQRNLYKELKDLPLVVTKDEKDWFEVTTASKEPETIKDTPNVLTRPVRRMPRESAIGKKRGELSADDYI